MRLAFRVLVTTGLLMLSAGAFAAATLRTSSEQVLSAPATVGTVACGVKVAHGAAIAKPSTCNR